MGVGRLRSRYVEDLDKACDSLADALVALEACRLQLNAQRVKVYGGYLALTITFVTALYHGVPIARAYVEKRLGVSAVPGAAAPFPKR